MRTCTTGSIGNNEKNIRLIILNGEINYIGKQKKMRKTKIGNNCKNEKNGKVAIKIVKNLDYCKNEKWGSI